MVLMPSTILTFLSGMENARRIAMDSAIIALAVAVSYGIVVIIHDVRGVRL